MVHYPVMVKTALPGPKLDAKFIVSDTGFQFSFVPVNPSSLNIVSIDTLIYWLITLSFVCCFEPAA